MGAIVGLNVPKTRIVEYTNVEWVLIKESLLTYIKNYNDNKNNNNNNEKDEEEGNIELVEQKLRSELNRAFFLVIDFVNGSPLECNYQIGSYLSLDSLDSRNLFCQSLGSIIAFDILINNCDRIPLVHNNDGNASNILITKEGECVPIDTVLTSIHPVVSSRNLTNYINKITRFFSIIFSIPQVDNQENSSSSIESIITSQAGQNVILALNPLKDFIYRSTVYNISDEVCILIAIEIQKSIRRISSLLNDEIIQNLKEKVSHEVTIDWEGVWETSLKLINLEYLSSILNIFKQYSI